MGNIQAILNNKILLVGIIAWFVAQGYKVLTTLISERRFDFERVMGSGGMPSSHTASIVGVTFAIGESLGYDHPMFALALLVSFIVMYDAANVRMAAGRQAKVLNKLVKELSEDFTQISNNEELRELLGHTYLEVLIGALLGMVIGILMV